MNFRPIKKEYLDHDPIYRFLRKPQKGPRKSFMLFERGVVEKVSLFEEHFYGDKLLAFFFRPKVYKFLKLACYPGLILITVRLIMSSIELARVVYKNVGVFLDEKSNRHLFEIFTELEVIAILRDFLKYEAVVFGANFDDLWCFFSLSSHPKVIADIRRQKSYLTVQFIVLTFIDAAMIIGAQFLYLSMRGWRLYLNLATKFGLIWGHFLYPFLIYDIQIVSLFLAKGYSYIGWSLKAASERAKDAHQAELIDAKWITYYQNLYELLTDLTDQFDGIKSFFMNIFYLTVAPKVVTVIYDILFTGMKYKLFHFGELVLAVLRIQVITLYVSLIYQSASNLWKEVYEVSLAKDDLGLFIQTNLFMKRITQREVGIKILGFYIIQPSIGPTMVTLVVAYFVAIVSLQFKDGNHGHHNNLTMIIPLEKLNQSILEE